MNRTHDIQAALNDVDARVEAGDARRALLRLFELLTAHPFLPDALARAAEVTRLCGAAQEAPLFARVAEVPGDSQALYDLGYLLVESGFPMIGVAYLERCLELEPGQPLVRYEAAYAHFSAGDYERAGRDLSTLVDSGELCGEEGFAAELLLVESLLYNGEGDLARDVFDKIDVADSSEGGEQRMDAVAHLLARADALPCGPTDARDWHFVERGGVVLGTGEDRAEAWVPAITSLEFLARLVRTLESVLAALEIEPEEIQALGYEMLPIAQVLARRLGVPLAHDGTPATERRLVLAHDGDAISREHILLRNRDDAHDLFALSFDPRRDYPITPDIVGQFAADLRLPWEVDPASGAAPLTAPAMDAVLGASALERALEDLEGPRELEAARYYAALKELLVAGNYEQHPVRRVFATRRNHGPR